MNRASSLLAALAAVFVVVVPLVGACGPPAPTTPVTIGDKVKSTHGAQANAGDLAKSASPGNQLGKAPSDMPSPHGSHGSPGQATPAPTSTSALALAAPTAVVLTIDGAPFTKADLERAMLQAAGLAGIPPEMLDAKMREAFEQPAYEKLIERALLVKEAKKRNLWPDDKEAAEKRAEILKTLPAGKTLDDVLKSVGADEKSFDEDLRVDVALGKLLKSVEQGVPPPPPATIEAVYQQNKAVFTVPDVVAAAHILVKIDRSAGVAVVEEKRKLAEQIKSEVAGKDDAVFARIASLKSEDPSGRATGGDLGVIKRGEYLPEFEAVAFKLKEGEVGGPVRTDRGFHVIKGGGMTPGKTVPAKEAKEIIAERERVKLFLTAVDDLVEGLRKSSTIVRVIEPAASPLIDPNDRGSRVPNWRATGRNAVKGMGNPHQPGPALKMPRLPNMPGVGGVGGGGGGGGGGAGHNHDH